jgi:hypothetical protein
MKNLVGSTLLGVALLVGAADAHAQPARAERTLGGLWIGVEYGVGQASIEWPAGMRWDGTTGYATSLAVGGTPSPAVDVGGEFSYFRSFEREGRIAELSGAAAIVRFFPDPGLPLLLRGSIGFGALDTRAPGGTATDRGVLLRGGAGYEIRLTRAYALTPTVGIATLLTGREADVPTPYTVTLTFGLVRY